MKSILVPTDFSDQAGLALDLAQQLATKLGAAIKLLHVVEQPGSHYLTAVSGGLHDQADNVYVLRLIERVKSQLQTLTNNLANAGIKASYKIKIGNPFKHISSQIEDEGHDLIIMGTQGISGISEIVVGSNTEKVIRTARCPVITLKKPVKLQELNEIVFAVGAYNHTDHMAMQLKIVQNLFDAKLHMVTVNTPGNFLVERTTVESLKEFALKYDMENYTVSLYSDITEEEGILHFTEDMKADAIAMATRGLKGLSHLLAGSLSEDMVNHSLLPVITFPISSKEKRVARESSIG